MTANRRSAVCHLLLAWCSILLAARGEDWPAYLGPNGNGTSSETGLALTWDESGPPVVWRKTLGESFSPPVVGEGRLVVLHRVGEEEVVECLDAKTGRSCWNASYGTRYVDRYNYNGGPRSSPAIDGDRVFTYGAEGVVSCWELDTGKRVWQRPLHEDLRAPQEFFGVGTPPVVDGDLVLLNPGGPDGAGLVALNKRDGSTVWKTGDCGASYSTPLVADIDGKRQALFLAKSGLFIVAPRTGEILREFPFRSELRESVNAASPVVVGNEVFLSAAYKVGAVLLRVQSDGLEAVWRDVDVMQNHWATSIHHDGFLYGIHGRHSRDAVMRCVDWDTGKLKWESPWLRGRLTFIMADGHFIAMDERGYLVVIKVDPERYVKKAEARLLRPPCWAPPILANGLLYVRNEIELLCLDLRPQAPE